MISLVEELQGDALDQSVAITDLLRKAKTAAVKLKRADLTEWLEHELVGYRHSRNIPEYRLLYTELKFFNPVRGWCPIVGDWPCFRCGQPISEILSLLESDSRSYMISVSEKVTTDICEQIGFPTDVKQQVSRSSLAGVVDAVRNAVLDWALKLEEAGVRGDGLSFSKADAEKANEMTINIGTIGNAVGIGRFGDRANITAPQTINGPELAAAVAKLVDQFESVLPNSRLPAKTRKDVATALTELREAASEATPDTGRLQRGLDALKRVAEHAAGHVVGAGMLALVAQVLPAL